ncbi:uncharacterized protein LOC113851351 [Abrus precatorius]|uniref:DNA N(6)-methyladenine demethylase n=1 Tax=Abrus precatorius TaxID=3816 RepID=A0A8B8K1M5_ABRPR|nr:uncharacterized protein LOC113851351 [Abrus precatorius]
MFSPFIAIRACFKRHPSHIVVSSFSLTASPPSNAMAKTVNSTTESSPAEQLPTVSKSNAHKNPVMAGGLLSDTSHDDDEYLLFGTIRSTLRNNNMVNYSHSVSTSSTSSTNKLPGLPSPTTTGFEHGKFKKIAKVDQELTQASGDNCRKPSCCSSFENTSLTNLTKHGDESPLGSHSWKKKAASVNRPYNSHCNSSYAAAGHKLYSSISMPKFQPYDICFRRRRNSAVIEASVQGENKESYIEMDDGGTKEGILRPGMVLLKHYLTHDEQVEIVKTCRELGLGPGGFYQPGYATGAKLRLKMMCLGMDWDPQTRKYGNKRVIDGTEPPSIPNHFSELVIRAIQDAHSLIKEEYRLWNGEDILPSMTPDICIVNSYTTRGNLGLHQDRDESRESLRKGLPVVSFSIGDTAEFLYGDQRNVEEAEKVLLESGDVLIFGGESRLVFHGVSSVLPNSAPKDLLEDTWLRPGRLNLTFRHS